MTNKEIVETAKKLKTNFEKNMWEQFVLSVSDKIANGIRSTSSYDVADSITSDMRYTVESEFKKSDAYKRIIDGKVKEIEKRIEQEVIKTLVNDTDEIIKKRLDSYIYNNDKLSKWIEIRFDRNLKDCLKVEGIDSFKKRVNVAKWFAIISSSLSLFAVAQSNGWMNLLMFIGVAVTCIFIGRYTD